MEEFGTRLRQAREKLGLTHDEVERATRIRTRYLEALERGELETLPSSVQARGFLHNYAEFLGLDTESILLQYAERVQAKGSKRSGLSLDTQPTTRPTVQVRSRRPRWLSTDLFIAAAITLALLFVLVWGGSRVMQGLAQDREGEAAPGLLILSSATATLTQAATAGLDSASTPVSEAAATPGATLPPELTGGGPPESGIALRLLIERRSWVSVSVDGAEAFRGRVAPGEILEYRGEQLIHLVTGNGSGIRAVFNGEDQGRLGEVGEVVERIWTLEGVVTPTPSVTPIPSETPIPSATPIQIPGG